MTRAILTLLGAMILSSSAAGAELAAKCDARLEVAGTPTVDWSINIQRENDQYFAEIIQIREGEAELFVEPTVLIESLVSDTLNEKSDPAALSPAEKYVLQAWLFAADPRFGPELKAGLDLTRIHKVKIYEFGVTSGGSATAVAQTFAKDGAPTGSFFGGPVVAVCK